MISRKQRSDSPFILLNIIYRFTFEEQSCGSGIACVPLLYLVRTRAQFLEHFFYKERFKIHEHQNGGGGQDRGGCWTLIPKNSNNLKSQQEEEEKKRAEKERRVS